MSPSSETLQRDPVCGMQIEMQRAAGTAEKAGKTYYFCSPACKEKFEEHPKQFENLKQSANGCGGAG